MNIRRYLTLAICAMPLADEGQGAVPTSFGFGPNNGWVIVYEDHGSWGYRYRGLPADLAGRIDEVSKDQVIYGVAWNDDSWVLAASKKWYSHNLPDDLEQYLHERTSQGYQIIDVALTKSSRWVVFSRMGTSYSWRSSGGDVPQELVDFLRQATDSNHRVLGVGITPDGGWAASYRAVNSVIYRLRNVPPDALEYTNELDRK